MTANILDYGAVPDGQTLCTGAVQAAIDTLSASGGQVLIPAGRFLCGSLRLRSNIDLHLEQGAVLISSIKQEDMIDFSKDFEDDNADTGWEGGCFLFAMHEKNISITGEGTIDGQGRELFYDDDRDGGLHECPLAVRGFRPRMSFLEDIENLTVSGVTFYDSAFWTLHMAGCRDVLIDNIRILNNERGPNNDGIDPDCCTNVLIRNCIIRAGDDAIVLKTTAPMAKKYGECKNIVIQGCSIRSHSSALKLGTETWADIHHVIMSDCILEDCTRGFSIWSRDGGDIHDITIHHINGNTRGYSSSLRGGDGVVVWWGSGEPIFLSATKRAGADRLPGKIFNIRMDHLYMTCEGSITIAGEDYSPISHIRINDSEFIYKLQSSHLPEYLDETPSERGCYKHELPCIYIRCCEDIKYQSDLTVDDSLKEVFKKKEIVE
ncbi:MAG: right-handed parallel beta-helix repeat-containing protein [Lachnospiraceae bacterium]|nr:right-handed parallel beta-helix repeat-containing protein [Lachnospiraceae bacterium]